MGQHLYPCERCGRTGQAWYAHRLEDGLLVNVRLCKACHEGWQKTPAAQRDAYLAPPIVTEEAA